MSAFISVILLAAGESKRMGRPKLLLPFNSTTILEKSIDNFLNSNVDEIIVVVGYRAEELLSRIAKKPVKIVANPRYDSGMSTSVISGLNVVDRKAQGVMIALADQPLINNRVIDDLVDGFRKGKKGIVIPIYRGRQGHPVIFSLKYKKELLKLKGDVGGRQLIDKHPDDVFQVLVDSQSVIADIDTLDDYAQLA
jgi:molybdenum cofactor cytidylyltransferase